MMPMFFGSSEEMRAAMENARMNGSLVVHTFNNMIDNELNVEQLRALASMFEVCVGNESAAAQFFGQITTVLRIKHNSCQCGRDCHKSLDVDEAIEKITGQPPVPVVEPTVRSAQDIIDMNFTQGDSDSADDAHMRAMKERMERMEHEDENDNKGHNAD